MYESGTRLAAEVTSDVEEFLQRQKQQSAAWADARSFHTRIRRNIRLAEAPSFGQSIFRYAPESNGAKDYRRLACEVAGLPLDSLDDAVPVRGCEEIGLAPS
jgi:chromosome partitioning protein